MASRTGSFGSSLNPYGTGSLSLDQMYQLAADANQAYQEQQAPVGPAPASVLTPEMLAAIQQLGLGGGLGASWQLGTTAEGQRTGAALPQIAAGVPSSRYGTQVQPDGTATIHPDRYLGILEDVRKQLPGASLAEQQDRALQHLVMENYGLPGAAGGWGDAVNAAYSQAQSALAGMGQPAGPSERSMIDRVKANPNNARANAVVSASAAYKKYVAANPNSNPEEYRIRQQAAKARGSTALASFNKAVASGKTF